MLKSLYLTATEPRSGKSAIVLGLMQLLKRDMRKVAIFRPIIGPMAEQERDHDVNLILTEYRLDQPYEETFAYTLREARELINSGQSSLIMEVVLNKYKELEDEYDFVLCEGTDFMGKDAAFEFELNADLAANLGSPVMLVINGRDKNAEDLIESALINVDTMGEKPVDMAALIINRFQAGDPSALFNSIRERAPQIKDLPIYAIPEDENLGHPTVKDVMRWLDARVLYGHGRLETRVDDFVVAAMQISNFLDYIESGSLIITPGDRSDIILSSLASRLSSSYPDISGILLTGGIEPPGNVHRLIEGWTGVPIPVLMAQGDTYSTSQRLTELYGRIHPEDSQKIASALGVFEASVDQEELRNHLQTHRSEKVTPKMFEYKLIEKAKADRRHIVLPEGKSERILRAADILLRRSVVDVTIIGDPVDVKNKASGLGLNIADARLVNPADSDRYEEYYKKYFELRKHKGIREEDAKDSMHDPTYFATMMVNMGDADGMVSGSVTTTGQTILPAFQIIKTKPGVSVVSSVFLMCLKDRVLVYGDCAVNPNPDAGQLAEIAISSAETAALFDVEPRVAMLSYSTGESGKGADVEKVAEATRLAKEKRPDLPIEGPIQYDAAVDAAVAETKMPESKVAGRATVFIFPDLNTGNNTYKAVQRSADSVMAIGPILQGLNKPVNDLSRGCTVPDIVNTVAITAVQAQAEKNKS
jgi:phosphate acetyltransferase